MSLNHCAADELLRRRRALIVEQVGLDKLQDWLPKWDAWERDVARYLDQQDSHSPTSNHAVDSPTFTADQ